MSQPLKVEVVFVQENYSCHTATFEHTDRYCSKCGARGTFCRIVGHDDDNIEICPRCGNGLEDSWCDSYAIYQLKRAMNEVPADDLLLVPKISPDDVDPEPYEMVFRWDSLWREDLSSAHLGAFLRQVGWGSNPIGDARKLIEADCPTATKDAIDIALNFDGPQEEYWRIVRRMPKRFEGLRQVRYWLECREGEVILETDEQCVAVIGGKFKKLYRKNAKRSDELWAKGLNTKDLKLKSDTIILPAEEDTDRTFHYAPTGYQGTQLVEIDPAFIQLAAKTGLWPPEPPKVINPDLLATQIMKSRKGLANFLERLRHSIASGRGGKSSAPKAIELKDREAFNIEPPSATPHDWWIPDWWREQ